MGLPQIIAVQQDDGSWAAYDDNKFEGDASALTVGRGDTRDEALNDFVDACEWTDAGNGMIKQIVFALADQEAIHTARRCEGGLVGAAGECLTCDAEAGVTCRAVRGSA